MQKKVKPLKLNKETVRNLSSDDLKKIAGGSEISVPHSCCRSCVACPSAN